MVWVTKYKKKFLGGDIERRLKKIWGQMADEMTFEIKEMECDREDIHLLIAIDPQLESHEAVKRIKGRSRNVSNLKSEGCKINLKLEQN